MQSGHLGRLGGQGLALFSLPELLANEVFALGHHLAVFLALAVPSQLACQAALRELLFSALADLLDSFHSLDGSVDEVAVVLDGGVSLLGELRQDKRRVDNHFLAASGTVSLGPLELARLALHLEILMAFRAAESKLTRVVPVTVRQVLNSCFLSSVPLSTGATYRTNVIPLLG